MKNIFACGTEEGLINTMMEEGYAVTRVDISEDEEEQTWYFLLEDIHYNYETKVIFQVNEYGEGKEAIAINVVKVTCELIGK